MKLHLQFVPCRPSGPTSGSCPGALRVQAPSVSRLAPLRVQPPSGSCPAILRVLQRTRTAFVSSVAQSCALRAKATQTLEPTTHQEPPPFRSCPVTLVSGSVWWFLSGAPSPMRPPMSLAIAASGP